MTASREQDYYNGVRDYARLTWEGIQGLKMLQAEWNANAYGDNLDPGAGDNAGLIKTDLGAAVFETANALITTLSGGHDTNLAKLL